MQDFKEDDTHCFFLSLGAEAKTRKVILDGVRYLPVRDVIMLGNGSPDIPKATSAWSDLRADVKAALAPYMRKHQFPGAGNRPVDVITMRGAMQLLIMMPMAPVAIMLRGKLVDTMCRVMAGDVTLIPEIQRNAASNGPMQQAAREILRDGMGPDAGGAAHGAIIEGIHAVQQFAGESEGRVLKALDAQGMVIGGLNESLSSLGKTLEEQVAAQALTILARDATILAHEETIRTHEETIVAHEGTIAGHETTINYLRGEKDEALSLVGRQAFMLGKLRGLQTEHEAVQGERNLAEARLIAANAEIKTLKDEVDRQKRLASDNKEELAAHMREVFDLAYGQKRARTSDAA